MYGRSPESGDLWYTSRQLKKKICSPSEGPHRLFLMNREPPPLSPPPPPACARCHDTLLLNVRRKRGQPLYAENLYAWKVTCRPSKRPNSFKSSESHSPAMRIDFVRCSFTLAFCMSSASSPGSASSASLPARERERVCVCVCERERERERDDTGKSRACHASSGQANRF